MTPTPACAPALARSDPAIEHGTLTGYVVHKCRCQACRGASRVYANRVRRLRAYGRWQPYADAAPVREHLALLAAHGVGWARAATLAGVSAGTVSRLLYGGGSYPPSRRIRPATAARILALRPALDLLADRALTDATGTRRRIQALMTRGFTQTYLAGHLGADRANLRRALGGERVQARTTRAVTALYDQLWNTDPADCGITARDSRYARTIAERRGWAAPMAWDDESIDDPAAQPDPGAKAKRQTALVEDAAFITKTTGVTDPDLIAARLGVSRSYLEKAHEREHARIRVEQEQQALQHRHKQAA